MKKLVLIDGHALVHRAFHALPPTMASPKGVPTNAVYGFVSVLLKTLKDIKPDYVVATFDLAGPTFRHEEFAEYKAHREKAPNELHAQVPIVKEVLGFFGIPVFEKEGFEADDVIGSIAEEAKKNKDLQTIIATGDLDTLQLVEKEKVVVLTLKKGVSDTILYTEKEVKNRYGLKPEQLNDFKGLKGDPSDNIPGVPGIGEKTASALIQKFKNLEFLYEEISNLETLISKQSQNKNLKKNKTQIKPPLSEKLVQKLLENKDMAFFSKKLATITRNVDVGFDINNADWRGNLDRAGLEKMFKDLGMFSLAKRLNELGPASFEQPSLDVVSKQSSSGSLEVKELKTKDEIKNGLVDLQKTKEFVFDITADGVFIWSPDMENFFGFDLGEITIDKSGTDELWKMFTAVFEDEQISKSGHDLKPLIKKFLQKDIHVRGLEFDTKIAGYLLKADRKDYELELMYRNEFGEELGSGDANRLMAILKLKKFFWERLKSEDLLKVFENMEMLLVSVLAEMELAGIKIDTGALKKLDKAVSGELIKLEKEIYKQAGIQFNINSPKQLKEILFERLGLKGKVRKTAKGALSTAADELDKLSGEHPIVDLILKYRELQKLKTTYIEPFPKLIDPETGRLRTTFNQTGTVTGRLSSQDPNLQNIPIRTELGQEFRKAFVSSAGFKLVSFDYSQLELRIVAHISGDKKMTEAFKRGEDIHTRTAVEIFNVAPDKVTPNMRREAKVFNFGILYGMGILGLQRAAGLTREEARGFINRYMEEFSGIAKYVNDMNEKARKDGYVSTIFGRRRWLPEIKSGMPQIASQAERMAVNMPIQGTGGDLLRIAMNGIYELMHKEYKDDEVRMLIQVHDELLFETKEELVEKISPQIKEIMENVYKFDVPLIVDVKSGNNWAEMQPL